jgi:threonine/homoserine/homoserine lactone efflux protein
MMLFLFLLSVVGISLSGVMMPGPVLAVTVVKAYNSQRAGSLVALGHGIIEFPLMGLIYFGFVEFLKLNLVKLFVGIFGGIILIYMGISMIKIHTSPIDKDSRLPYNSVISGIITTAFNPYFFLWWASVGAALIMKSLIFGLIGFILFAVIHWLCDLGWYSIVSLTVYRTHHLWNKKLQEVMFNVCGLALFGFGIWFIYSAIA